MTRDEVLTKLISIRHYCFQRGVLKGRENGDFRMAFRTLNRLYVELRDNAKPISERAGRRRTKADAQNEK